MSSLDAFELVGPSGPTILKRGRVLAVAPALATSLYEKAHTVIHVVAKVDIDQTTQTIGFKASAADQVDAPLIENGDEIIIGAKRFPTQFQPVESLSIIWNLRKRFIKPSNSAILSHFSELGTVKRRALTLATPYTDKHETMVHLAVLLKDSHGLEHYVTFKGLASEHHNLILAQVGASVEVTYQPLYLEDSATVRLGSLSIDWEKSLQTVQPAIR